jgi:hypothetical protein
LKKKKTKTSSKKYFLKYSLGKFCRTILLNKLLDKLYFTVTLLIDGTSSEFNLNEHACLTIRFLYVESIILDRVDSITDLGVEMDSRMSFSRHIDVTVGKALVMLGFVKRLSGEFKDP